MIILSVGGLAMDWSISNQDGSYRAWLDSPYSQPSLSTVVVERVGGWPVGAAARRSPRGLTFYVQIMAKTGVDALRATLMAALDTEQAAKALIVTDDDGGNPRYWMCNFQAQQERDDARGIGMSYAVTATIVEDPYPRSTATEQEDVTLTASGQWVNCNNAGHLDTYPTITIEAQAAKSGGTGWTVRKFLPVIWEGAPATGFPTLVWQENTTTLTPTYAIDETSVALIVDGVEVDRWFAGANGAAGGFDSTTTKMWANIDWRQGRTFTLARAITDGGVAGVWANEVTVLEDISDMPESGLLRIEDEVFRYRHKDNARKTFLDASREFAATWASHAINVNVYWLQHEMWVLSAPATSLAKTADDSRKPMLDLAASTNGKFVWDGAFGSEANPNRSAQWLSITPDGAGIFTSEGIGEPADPWEVMGVAYPSGNQGFAKTRSTRWQFTFPGEIYDFDITAEHKCTSTVVGNVHVSANGGTTWTRVAYDVETSVDWASVLLAPAASILDLYAQTIAYWIAPPQLIEAYGQVTTASVSWIGGATNHNPMPWQANYSLAMTIRNETLDEAIALAVPVGLSLFVPFIIDCEDNTVVSRWLTFIPEEYFDTNHYAGMTKDSHRPHMLRLAPGSNTITFTETGLVDVDVRIEWQTRRYF